ncbi:MAG TPA: hypothetical protein PLU51_05990 [Bacteroidia bacterium]|nr:hypothetical protein [Bacteroidia bacterium]
MLTFTVMSMNGFTKKRVKKKWRLKKRPTIRRVANPKYDASVK